MKTTVVNGVLISYKLMLTIYLGTRDGVLDRVTTISFGSDAVTDLVLGRIITPLPHSMAQLPPPPSYFNSNKTIVSILYTIPFHCFVIISTRGNLVYPWGLCT
jgi:hypothetical protein